MTAKTAPAVDREDGSYGVCPSCHLERPLDEDGESVRPHNRFIAVVHRPGELPGRMIPCAGSSLAPVSVLAPDFISPDEDG